MLHEYFLIQWIQLFETRDASRHIILIKEKEEKEKNIQFSAFPNTCSITKYFQKLTSLT